MWPQKETEERLGKRKSLLYSQALLTGGMAHHVMPHEKKTIRLAKSKKTGWSVLRPQLVLGFLQERQS